MLEVLGRVSTTWHVKGDMEGHLSVYADGEWDTSDINFLNDDVDFILHQLFNNEVAEGSNSTSIVPAPWSFTENSTNVTEANTSFYYHMDSTHTNSYHLLPQYGFSCHMEVGVSPQQPYKRNVPSDYYMMDTIASPAPMFSNGIPEDGPFIAGVEMSQVEPDILISIPTTPLNLKRNLNVSAYGQQNSTSSIPNKKSRTVKNDCGNKMKSLPKKNGKTCLHGSDAEAINSTKQMSSSSYSSEDDSNASQELNAGTSSDTKLMASLEKNGKKTGRRGSAIDPQSLYARKRRERINERLKILQNLVPNGTKVDISTMLEEAVSYVKFLQTQIKLLSSDDLWMYAPIAYNGVDVGLDRRLSHNL